MEQVLEADGIPYVIYDGTQPNPTVANVEEVLTLYHENGCDTLIGIGGGPATAWPMPCLCPMC